ncbi:hypothetical protein OIE68_19675 [Nocardia vinacea]|uniref:hypothetical protein n=1 Tax=Nocardia vinacea TaxID=96468 RepID=UPI002E10FC35|nr:hypothetical protein OIE68_19675 [Nocardia vinacea]
MINVSELRGAPRPTECPDQARNAKGRNKIRALSLLAAIAAGVGGFGIGTEIPAANADIGVRCLWAGEAVPQGVAISAGGWTYRCQSDFFGFARWSREGYARGRSSVYNPGTNGNPAGKFSPGAQQPGTDYMDYCVGSQLIEGREDIYEAVADGRGGLYWRAAGPISDWTFDMAANRPGPSWRSSSLCIDGNLT